jgi:hypothetical protein
MGRAAARVASEHAPWPASWELAEDEAPMAEGRYHDRPSHLLAEVFAYALVVRKASGSSGRNLALRWDPLHPGVGVDPDVYLVEPEPPGAVALTSLRTWLPGHVPPRVAVEVVSASTAAKDYLEGPRKYAASGTRELWVFDPMLHGPGDGSPAFVLQVWGRDRLGRFRRVYAGPGPARAQELGAWLVVTDVGTLLRVADDPHGVHLWPTAEEAERAAKEAAEQREADERAAKEVAEQREADERAAKEEAEQREADERAAKEAAEQREADERAAKEAALAEVEQLRAELARNKPSR